MKQIKLDHITKIEGHANVTINIDRGKLKDVRFETVEGARFFEGIVTGRKYYDVQKFVSRICGVCSQAHLLGSILAIENAMGIFVSDQTRKLRRLVNIAAIIQSHCLHDFFLALPDYLGFESAISMASKYPDEVKLALAIKRIANDINQVIGGRDIHCITLVPGGFTKLPSQEDIRALYIKVKEGKRLSVKAAKLFISLKYPDFERETEYVALRDDDRYALDSAHIVSTKGLDIEPSEYKNFISEIIKDYAASKFALLNRKGYFVGALPRLNINHDKLSKDAKKLISSSGLQFPSHNPFHNNLAQAIEMVSLFDEAIEILEDFRLESACEPDVADYDVCAGHGYCAIEVPRGLLLHEYDIDETGTVKYANIIAPTTQNLKNIEDDLTEFIGQLLSKKVSKEKLIFEVEKLIRAYDPCISCSTHGLKIKINKR